MTPQQRLRKHQRALEKTQRELDRERVKLENQEKKLVQDIKKSAKNGQMGACKIQAKDLVRTRRSVECPCHRPQPSLGSDRCVEKLHELKRFCYEQVHRQILRHAYTAPSHLPPNTNGPIE